MLLRIHYIAVYLIEMKPLVEFKEICIAEKKWHWEMHLLLVIFYLCPPNIPWGWKLIRIQALGSVVGRWVSEKFRTRYSGQWLARLTLFVCNVTKQTTIPTTWRESVKEQTDLILIRGVWASNVSTILSWRLNVGSMWMLQSSMPPPWVEGKTGLFWTEL